MNIFRKINLKKIFNKLLLMFLVIGTILVCGCSCGPDNPDDPIPPFPVEETDEVYLNVKQGTLSYDIYKNDMYINMKNTYGVGVIADWCDELLLKTVNKKEMYKKLFGNSAAFDEFDETFYWDKVSDSEVVEAIEKEMFPNGREGLTEDEINQKIKTFNDNFAVYGYFDYFDIMNYYHRRLASLEVAKDYQEMFRSNIDFEPTSYQNYYTAAYKDEFYMILIPFNTMASYYGTLRNLGITIKTGTGSGNAWMWIDSEELLTKNEVIETFMRLYQETNIFKASGSEAAKLVEGVDYTLVNGEYVFNTTDKGQLFYSSEQCAYLDSDLYNLLSTSFTPYTESSETNNWYWASGREFGNSYYTCLLIAKDDRIPYEEAKPIIREILMRSEIDYDYANQIMLVLRQVNNLLIYDISLQDGYSNTYGSGSIPEIDVDNGDVVVTFKDTLLTKNDLFTLMDKRFGAQTAIELVNYYNVLYNPEINNVYDLTKEKPEDRILNKERWNYAWETAEMEKADFEGGTYTKYGYPPSYGWEKFLDIVYNVRSTQELAYHYLRENCLYDYVVGMYNINNYGESSLLWQAIDKKLDELVAEEIYSVGLTFNIYYLDENGKHVQISDYTEEQFALAEELYIKALDYLLEDPDGYSRRVGYLIETFNDSPYVFDGKTSALDIDFSKYKSAGIKVGYSNMGTFSYTDYDGDLSVAIKTLYEAHPGETFISIYGRDDDGYHFVRDYDTYRIYINLGNPLSANVEGRLKPTYAECAEYLDAILNEKATELTTSQIDLVKKHYYAIFTEQIGIYSTALMLYKEQANYEINLKLANYDINRYRSVLTVNISDCEGQIQYKLDY